MHPRNPYRKPPDFFSLAKHYPALQPYLVDVPGSSSSTKKTIDFRNEDASRRLTEAIMLRDFGVKLTIPVDRLCPPVPNRLNYVLWIQDIVSASNWSKDTPSRKIHGIDIGTGSTAIYPFLACKTNKDLEMTGTELDDISYTNAVQNVEENRMQGRIQVRKATKQGRILFPLEAMTNITSFDFTMCNPPFYSSSEEVVELAEHKDDLPSAVCTGADVEMIYSDGGEAGFVGRMIEESLSFRGRCRWYTSMLGRMSSVIQVIDIFRLNSITNYAITEFVQGQTRRWAVGWSFLDGRLPDAIARMSVHPSHALASYMPPRNTLVHVIAQVTNAEPERDATHALVQRNLHEILGLLEDVHVVLRARDEAFDDGGNSEEEFFLEADGDSWSRAARRKRRSAPQTEPALERSVREAKSKAQVSSDMTVGLGPALACSIHVVCPASSSARKSSTSMQSGSKSNLLHSHDEAIKDEKEDEATSGPMETMMDQGAGAVVLRFQWVYGRDRWLFESFASHVGRKVKQACV